MRAGYTFLSYPNYEEYDLFDDKKIAARSDVGPALCAFQKRLWVFWRDELTGAVTYNRTDGQFKGWFDKSKIVSRFTTNMSPSVYALEDLLYVVWCYDKDPKGDQKYIVCLATIDKKGVSTGDPSTPLRIFNPDSEDQYLTSRYTPRLNAPNDRLKIFWGESDNDEDKIGVAFLQPPKTGDNTPADCKFRVVPYLASKSFYIDGGAYTSEIGNTAVDRLGNEWLFTVNNDNQVSLAMDPQLSLRYNLGKLSSYPFKTDVEVAACMMPGCPGKKWGTPWRILVIWKEAGNNNLRENYLEIVQ